jgi:Transposase
MRQPASSMKGARWVARQRSWAHMCRGRLRTRVTRRFRRRLCKPSLRAGAAHAEVARCERTSRYQVVRAFRVGAENELAARREARPARGCRSTRPTTAAAGSSPRWSPTSTAGGSSRCLTAGRWGGWSATCAPFQSSTGRGSRSSGSTPTRPTARRSAASCLGRGSCRPLPPRSRRRHRARLGSARARSASTARVGPRGAPVGQGRQLAPGPLPGPPPPLKARERLTERERRRLCALFEPEPLIAEAWALNETFRAIYRAENRHETEQRLDRFLAAVERAPLPASPPSPTASGRGAPSCSPTSTNRPPAATRRGVINGIKVIKRRGYGLPNFGGF